MVLSTYKKVGHIKDLLNSHQAFNEKILRRLIDGKAEIRHGDVTFKVLRPADLDLDSEHRSYSNNFDFQRTIFDCENISLRNSSRVNLIDCLVLGNLSIGDKYGEKTEVYLDTVAITRQLRITGRGEQMTSVSLVSVQARELVLYNFTTPEIGVMSSRFASTVVHCLMADSLMMTDSELGALSIAECDFQKVQFPAGQVCLGDLNASRLIAWLRKLRFKPLNFPVGPSAYRALESASRAEAKRREVETLKFLLERTDISYSKGDAAQLKYLRSLAESSSWISRFFVVATGGFIKPFRIVFWATVVIFGFALIYWREPASFRDAYSICSYWDALYFSGLTFTTIGYGDILPVYWMRGLAVLEGLLGIALSGAFLVSLTRRYIE